MIANDLIKSILDDISIKVYQGRDYSGSSTGKNRILVLLCGSDFDKNNVLKGLDQLAAAGNAITVVLSPNGEDFYSIEALKGKATVAQVYTAADKAGMERWIKNAESLWCPNVTQSTLSKVSMGITDTLSSCLVWRALAMQKPVTLTVNAAAHWTAALPEGHEMKKLLQAHLNKVESFGAILTTDYSLQKIEEVSSASISVKMPDVRLIHEGNLLELAGTQKKLVLKKGQLITPAARDLAKSRGIELNWK